MSIVSLIGFLVSLFPLVAVALVVVWLYRIKQNSDQQIEQNKEIITLLDDIKTGK